MREAASREHHFFFLPLQHAKYPTLIRSAETATVWLSTLLTENVVIKICYKKFVTNKVSLR